MSKYSHSGMQSDVSYAQKIYFVQILERNGNNEHTHDPSQTGRCGHAAVSLLRCQRNSLTFWKRRVFVFRQRTRSGMMDGHQLQVFRASGVRFLLSKPAGFSEGCTLQNNAEHFPTLEQDSIKKTHRSICFSFRAVTLLCVLVQCSVCRLGIQIFHVLITKWFYTFTDTFYAHSREHRASAKFNNTKSCKVNEQQSFSEEGLLGLRGCELKLQISAVCSYSF